MMVPLNCKYSRYLAVKVCDSKGMKPQILASVV